MPDECNEAPNPRQMLLEQALTYVMKDRNASYDAPEDNFRRIADYWNPYLEHRGSLVPDDRPLLAPHDIAILNILQKVARLAYNPDHADSWVDIAGYAACGWDCVVAESFEEPDPEPAMAQVIELHPNPEQYEGEIVPVYQKGTGALGWGLFFDENMFISNRDQLVSWLESHGEPYSDSMILPGYWYILLDDGKPATAMDPNYFYQMFDVLAVSVS